LPGANGKENLNLPGSAKLDSVAIAKRGLNYENLDQLTMDILLGVREKWDKK